MIICCWPSQYIVESVVFRYNESSFKSDYGLKIMEGFCLSFLSEGYYELN